MQRLPIVRYRIRLNPASSEGPYTLEELQSLWDAGRLTYEYSYSIVGVDEWRNMEEVFPRVIEQRDGAEIPFDEKVLRNMRYWKIATGVVVILYSLLFAFAGSSETIFAILFFYALPLGMLFVTQALSKSGRKTCCKVCSWISKILWWCAFLMCFSLYSTL